MPDPYYDQITALMLSLPHVWVALDDQGGHGLRYVAGRPTSDVVEDLIQAIRTEGLWRCSDVAHRPDGTSCVKITNEIDRSIDVNVAPSA